MKKRSTRAKAKKDLRRAKQATRMKAAELKAKARKDIERAGEQTRTKLREAAEGRTAGNVEAPQTTEEIFRLAGESAQLRSPVDATLDPSPDGPLVESMATDVSSPNESENSGGMINPGFITGESEPFHDSDGSGDGEDVPQKSLEFSDDFINGGSW